MRLCDTDIVKHIEQGLIKVDPSPSPELISGVTLDIRLGNKFRVFNDHVAPYVDLSGPKAEVQKAMNSIMSDELHIGEGDAFFLHPGELALGVTYEAITLPNNIVGWLDGRSSLARLGLMVHVTAHRIDPGWSGNIVLEFFNSGKLPLALRPKMKIGALNFETMSGPAEKPYNLKKDAKYRDQTGAVGSKISEDE